jgi:hypothetical protein
MHDEDDDDDLSNDASTGTVDAGKLKERTTSGRRAARTLQRARRLYEGSDWQPSKEGEFRIQEAMVLALLDLADAIREQTVSAPR